MLNQEFIVVKNTETKSIWLFQDWFFEPIFVER